MKYEDKAPTAYTYKQAVAYDELRFISNAGVKIHEAELDKVIHFLVDANQDSKILEVGCGTGRLLMECLDQGYNVDGVDASTNMLAELEDKLKSSGKEGSVELNLAEAAELPYNDDTYNYAYSIRLLNQTKSATYALDVIKEMVRVVKPGGYVLVECVNETRPSFGKSRGNTTRLNSADMKKAGMQAGANVIKVQGNFFLGMGAYFKFEKRGLKIVTYFDRFLSNIFPVYCSRIYVLFKVQIDL